MARLGILTRVRCAVGLHPWETIEGYARVQRPDLPRAPRPRLWVVQARCTNPACAQHFWRVIDEQTVRGSTT